MPNFKATVTQADLHKTKGAWVIKPPPQPPQRKTSGRGCSRFFLLPAELRNRIYEYAFLPGTTIVLRKDEPTDKKRARTAWSMKVNPTTTHEAPVLRCGRELGFTKRFAGINTKWETSLSGILLVNKQAYQEVVPYLYEQSVFAFSTFKLARAFLATIKSNRKSIRKLQLNHCTFAYGSSMDAKLAKDRADRSFIRLCQEIVASLPNLSSLEVTIKVLEHPDMIVPAFDEPGEVITARRTSRTSYVQACRAFCALQHLQELKIELLDSPKEDLSAWFFCSDYSSVAQYDPALGSRERQQEQVCQKWMNYRISLYESAAEAMVRVIKGSSETAAWRDHMEKLEEYRAFCYNQLAPTTVTRADPVYQAWLSEHVSKQ